MPALMGPGLLLGRRSYMSTSSLALSTGDVLDSCLLWHTCNRQEGESPPFPPKIRDIKYFFLKSKVDTKV